MRGDGSSNEETLRTGRRYRTDRTEGISDGVFAVSLTLHIEPTGQKGLATASSRFR